MGTTIVLTGTGDKPRFCYENLFNDDDATVSASSEQTDFVKEYAYNWQRYNWWQADAGASEWLKASFTGNKQANYLGIYAHDLFTNSAAITLQYSSDDSTWLDAFSQVTPNDNGPILIFFDVIDAKYWRLLVNSPTTGSKLGVVSFGTYMELERMFSPGFRPPKTSRDVKFTTKQSSKGTLLARRREYVRSHFNMPVSTLSPGFVDDEWLPFVKHLEVDGAFFLLWDPGHHINDVTYCEVTDPNWIGKPEYENKLYMSLSLESDGYVE